MTLPYKSVDKLSVKGKFDSCKERYRAVPSGATTFTQLGAICLRRLAAKLKFGAQLSNVKIY